MPVSVTAIGFDLKIHLCVHWFERLQRSSIQVNCTALFRHLACVQLCIKEDWIFWRLYAQKQIYTHPACSTTAEVKSSRGLTADLCFAKQRIGRLCGRVSWVEEVSGLPRRTMGWSCVGVIQSSVTDPSEIGAFGVGLTWNVKKNKQIKKGVAQRGSREMWEC